MLRNGLTLRTAIAVAILIAQPLAGCSGATKALPGFNPAVSMQQNSSGAIRPDAQDPCSGISGVQGPGTFWTESLGPPVTWTETTGYYVVQYTNGGIIYQPCPGSSSSPPCSPSPTCPGNTYNYHVQVTPALAAPNLKCTLCFLVAEGASKAIAVISASKKYVVTQVGTLSTTFGSVTYSPVGVAVAEDGTTYASVVSVVGSGHAGSCILVYPPGS